MLPKRVTTRSLLILLPLVWATTGCSSDGGSGTTSAAQTNPAGTWFVTFSNTTDTCPPDSNSNFDDGEAFNQFVEDNIGFAANISVFGSSVAIEPVTDLNSQGGLSATLSGNQLSNSQSDGSSLDLTFNDGFTSFSGVNREVDDGTTPSGGQCVRVGNVTGQRLSCAETRAGEFSFEIRGSLNDVVDFGTVTLSRDLCAMTSDTFTGAVSDRRWTGVFNTGVERGTFDIQVTDTGLMQGNVRRFLPKIDGSSIDIDNGTITMTPIPGVASCDSIETGTWEFDFGNGTSQLEGALTQNGCNITVENTLGDRFSGTLAVRTLTATGQGFFSGDFLTGDFPNGGTRFSGTLDIGSQTVVATGLFAPFDPGGGSDCPSVSSGTWSFDAGGLDFGGGTFTLGTDCTLSYFASETDDFGQLVTTNVTGSLSSAGVWTASGTNASLFGTTTIDLTATFSGDPAGSFSGNGTLGGDFPLGAVSFSGNAL